MTKTANTVAEAMSQAHARLLEDLRRLQEAVRAPFSDGPAELHSRLERMRTHLIEHFRLEEHGGYLDGVRQREPQVDRTIAKLRGEHRELTQALDDLLGEVKACELLEEALRAKVRDWIMHVRCHESRENSLIQDAFNLDISAED
jgi:iron-sulfur cluster repair protein YtfE (RIC family)